MDMQVLMRIISTSTMAHALCSFPLDSVNLFKVGGKLVVPLLDLWTMGTRPATLDVDGDNVAGHVVQS